jgi:death-on-curing protein
VTSHAVAIAVAIAIATASSFGDDAYPTIHDKVAALIHSIARSHALVDGNKRLALAGGIAFLGMNGLILTMSEDDAYDLIISVASGELDYVQDIARVLGRRTRPHHRQTPG